ncbi:ornithine cyclodeaminase family protein [Metasolibacillus meyeri]|uniref:Ornithine cyclodeaminase family protein n=1 Tax=Metasolibacillus meyeri TaxID=1071052 RepID=A0AAW9NRT7_9BACL|nr:ornithine cyclodeaminase family protein [Metasolibacillus meyeri]MEC1180317.1 ornithine cyclodeaminase family protein [Metasolibacillus meyeri]
MIILNEQEIISIYQMDDAIQDVKAVLQAKAQGNILAPHRTVLNFPAQSASALYMPSADLVNQMSAVKVVTIFPNNPAVAKKTTQGIIVLTSTEDGSHLAALNASYLTRLRTGAMSGIATDYLAKQDATALAVIGTGAMAFEQCLGVLAVRQIATIILYNRTAKKAEDFAQKLKAAGYKGKFIFEQNANQAVAQADIICCATKTTTPLFNGESLKKGTHINGVGSYLPHMHELDNYTITNASKIVVDDLPGAEDEAGELINAAQQGIWSFSDVYAELEQLVAGEKAGRQQQEEITFFKSVGASYYDLAVAQGVYKKALVLKIGTTLEV